jgi:RNA-directed DNA polymerase
MRVDRRRSIIRFYSPRKLKATSGGTEMSKTKPFCISRKAVMEAYLRVKANKGSAGIDEVSLEEFGKDLKNNLYRIWNRMSSGSYMPPPVLLVEIPKKDGGKRPLGIATVADRIAQTVVKMELEPVIDPLFHEDSYGYRPNKSALDAIGKCRERCWRYNWVLDLDIKDFFNSIPHDLMMKAIEKHTKCKWVLLYIKRWLIAPLQREDGSITEVTKGTAQGAVVSPIMANLFLHYCMDEWMRLKYPDCPFERYADDSVIHCRTKAEAERLKEHLSERMKACGLEMHEGKTKIVYCKGGSKKEDHPDIQFDFLGYNFRPRKSIDKNGISFLSFSPAVSNKSAKAMRGKMSTWNLTSKASGKLSEVARAINPIVTGWVNYYGRYHKEKLISVLKHVNFWILKWIMTKYKRFHKRRAKAAEWLRKIIDREPGLMAHWRIGVKVVFG